MKKFILTYMSIVAVLIGIMFIASGCMDTASAQEEEEITGPTWTEEVTADGGNLITTRTPDKVMPRVTVIDIDKVFKELKRLEGILDNNLRYINTEMKKLLTYVAISDDVERVREICKHVSAGTVARTAPFNEAKDTCDVIEATLPKEEVIEEGE